VTRNFYAIKQALMMIGVMVSLSGCMTIDAIVGTTISVTGAVVSTGVKVVGAAVDVVTPSKKED
jgi:hypothetical protein